MNQEYQIWVDFMARMIEKYGTTLDSDGGGDGDVSSEQEVA